MISLKKKMSENTKINKSLVFVKLIFILSELNMAVESQMEKVDGVWRCITCGWTVKYKTRLYEHVEAKHVDTSGYKCPICSKFCPSQKSLKNHKFNYHRNSGPIQFS